MSWMKLVPSKTGRMPKPHYTCEGFPENRDSYLSTSMVNFAWFMETCIIHSLINCCLQAWHLKKGRQELGGTGKRPDTARLGSPSSHCCCLDTGEALLPAFLTRAIGKFSQHSK